MLILCCLTLVLILGLQLVVLRTLQKTLRALRALWLELELASLPGQDQVSWERLPSVKVTP